LSLLLFRLYSIAFFVFSSSENLLP
jgi:hypothetical protein